MVRILCHSLCCGLMLGCLCHETSQFMTMICLSPHAMKEGGYIPWEAGSAHVLRGCMIFLGPPAIKGGRYILCKPGLAHALRRHMIFLGPSAVKGGGYIPCEPGSAHVLQRHMIFLSPLLRAVLGFVWTWDSGSESEFRSLGWGWTGLQ